MILTHESGSQEDQFDEKKWRQKISWDYPFKRETTDMGTTSFGRNRLYAHIAIVNEKIRSLRRYQGKRNNFFDTINKIITEWI